VQAWIAEDERGFPIVDSTRSYTVTDTSPLRPQNANATP